LIRLSLIPRRRLEGFDEIMFEDRPA